MSTNELWRICVEEIQWVCPCLIWYRDDSTGSREEILINIDPLTKSDSNPDLRNGFDTTIQAALRYKDWKIVTGYPGTNWPTGQVQPTSLHVWHLSEDSSIFFYTWMCLPGFKMLDFSIAIFILLYYLGEHDGLAERNVLHDQKAVGSSPASVSARFKILDSSCQSFIYEKWNKGKLVFKMPY